MMSLQFGVDHFVLLVKDLQAARAAFVDAGFAATPLARHSAASGTANSCIMLPDTYIEIMGIVEKTPASASWQALLDRGPGLRGLALRSTRIEDTVEMLEAKGIEGGEVRHFSRTMPEGELRFSAMRLPPSDPPGLQVLYCQHHTAELLWSADVLIHGNGARRIVSATVPLSTTLAPLADVDGPFIPVSDGSEGVIAIAFDQPVSAEALDRIYRETGLRIEKVLI